jgi:hypothetical protein
MLKALILIVAVGLIVPVAYADPVGPPDPNKAFWDSVLYLVEVAVSEFVAWIIGAELLWRLMKRTAGVQAGVSRSSVYKILLLVMIVSFLIGLLFWKALKSPN